MLFDAEWEPLQSSAMCGNGSNILMYIAHIILFDRVECLFAISKLKFVLFGIIES